MADTKKRSGTLLTGEKGQPSGPPNVLPGEYSLQESDAVFRGTPSLRDTHVYVPAAGKIVIKSLEKETRDKAIADLEKESKPMEQENAAYQKQNDELRRRAIEGGGTLR